MPSKDQHRRTVDFIPCKFRGNSVDCSQSEFASGKCDTCGWNPLVEAKRVALRKKLGNLKGEPDG